MVRWLFINACILSSGLLGRKVGCAASDATNGQCPIASHLEGLNLVEIRA